MTMMMDLRVSGVHLAAFAVVLAAFLLVSLSRFTHRKLPPGPTPWPILGNLPLIGTLPHRNLAKLAKRFGPIMTVWIGSTPSVVVSSPELARQVLRVHDQHACDRFTTRTGKVFTGNRDIASLPANDYWKEQRSLALLHLLSPKQLRQWQSSRQAEIDRMVAAMAKAGRGATEFPLTLHPFLSRATLNNILSMCCGQTFDYSDLLQDFAAEGGTNSEANPPLGAISEEPEQPAVLEKSAEESSQQSEVLPVIEKHGDARPARTSDRQPIACAAEGRDMGRESRRDGRHVVAIIDEIFQLSGAFNVAEFIPWLSWLDPANVRERAERTAAEWKAFCYALIDARRVELETEGAKRREKNADGGVKRKQESVVEEVKKSFLDHLLEREGEGRGKVTRDEMYVLLFDMILGGTDTSSRTTEWGLAELARHPHVMMRLQAEVDGWYEREREREREKKRDGERKWEMGNEGGGNKKEDVTELQYLQAVVTEIFRLHPVVTLLIPHVTNNSISLAGYHIPPGTLIQVNAWAISHDPSVWENPTKFDPARFLPPNKPVDVKGRDFRVIPFGTGRRGCPGLHLGYDLVARMIAAVVREFDLLPEEEGKKIDMSEEYGLTVGMKKSLHVKLHHRFNAVGHAP